MSMYGEVRTRVETGPGMAKQSMKEECDINVIVSRFDRTGALSHVAKGVPSFADVSEVTDYRSVLEFGRSADEYFAGLPAKVRARFGNDVARYVEALMSPDAASELAEVVREVYGDRRKPAPVRRRVTSRRGGVPEVPPVV